ncbi:ATP-binding protein [Solirubrobacter ginsenosidimutans]|uniref:ATP-binding protein n=1 Tax=Solirubrobacter ginsenosidimutans TaxID=490573 RepID=A0A9X3S5V0_9ACTN|nr:AAA family ATPase [Solirubrobacter ginsenosidimutans]MDA0164566.1 ATP-binding protein [Solirubrobacter ginsenosidimutans]
MDWLDFGFRSNPYDSSELPASEVGHKLLVGRDAQLRQLKEQLKSSANVVAVEGAYGVGKSSLIAVAQHALEEEFPMGRGQQLFLSASKPFQLQTDTGPTAFRHEVLYSVANALTTHRERLREAGLANSGIETIGRWLTAPEVRGKGGGLTTPFGGGTFNMTSGPNTSDGFKQEGFPERVEACLRECFPSRQQGGVICVIDNLEVLDLSSTRTLLEQIRDPLLRKAGLCWVLCGAPRTVRDAASSQRLHGIVRTPIEIGPIEAPFVGEVVGRRLEVYAQEDSNYTPVEPDGFLRLYGAVNRHLREALVACERYSEWLDAREDWPESPADKSQLLRKWLALEADNHLSATRDPGDRAWRLFDELAQEPDGIASSSDFRALGFKSPDAMLKEMQELQMANLAGPAMGEDPSRDETIEMTPQGRMVRIARLGIEKVF